MILTIANRKGGTGKTTMAVALATRLAADGERVLLVDLDSQANATEALAVQLQPGIFMWLGAEQKPSIVTLESGLNILPGDATTERVNLILSSEGDKAAIHRALKGMKRAYHYIIIDCPPSMSMLTRAAIYAADYVLVPTIPEYLSVAGVRQLVILLARIRERDDRPVRLLGIQINKYDRRTKEHKANLVDLVRAYGAWGRNGGRVWPPLRQSIAIAVASAEGRPIWELLKGDVLEEWQGLVERVKRHG